MADHAYLARVSCHLERDAGAAPFGDLMKFGPYERCSTITVGSVVEDFFDDAKSRLWNCGESEHRGTVVGTRARDGFRLYDGKE